MGVGGKLLRLVGVVFIVSLFTFMITTWLPGDPVNTILGPSAGDAQLRARVRSDLHLNDPLPVQYVKWVGGVLHGDLGRSYQNNQPVREIVATRLPVTLELLLLAQLIALILAIPIGVYSAYRRDTPLDKVITTTSFGLLSVPEFVMAVVLAFLFAVQWRLFPVVSWTYLGESITGNLRSAILPSLILALPVAAVYTRLLRSDMIATLQEDYVLMARAEGLPTRRILFRHALRPSSFSLLTIAGINMGALIGGAVIVEYLFALPGMGLGMVDAVARRNYPVIQGLVLVIAIGYVLVNVLVDVLYSVLDPRIRNVRALA